MKTAECTQRWAERVPSLLGDERDAWGLVLQSASGTLSDHKRACVDPKSDRGVPLLPLSYWAYRAATELIRTIVCRGKAHNRHTDMWCRV